MRVIKAIVFFFISDSRINRSKVSKKKDKNLYKTYVLSVPMYNNESFYRGYKKCGGLIYRRGHLGEHRNHDFIPPVFPCISLGDGRVDSEKRYLLR
ncbi:MAG: hypothetical protein JXA00_00560 [Candidatus Thermoplasmatota archaeon]|nr:hypothetical protein [Candidatus Thermoplasmatota archaeon]